MESHEFFEKQFLRKGKLFIIGLVAVAFSIILLAYSLISQLIFDKPIGTNTLGNQQLMIFSVILFCILLPIPIMMYKSFLITTISKTEIRMRYFPFQNSFLVFPFSEIEKWEVRQYNPIKEYGGWGVRYNFKTKEKAYNVSGNFGIQLYLKNGRKVLIGTQKPDEARAVLNNFLSA